MLRRHEEGNALRAIPSYYEIRRKEREEAELQHDTELKGFFLRALEYYQAHYPLSFQSPPNRWDEKKTSLHCDTTKLFKETIESYSEAQLYTARVILSYSIKERNYKKIAEMEKFQELIGVIIQLIPGGKFLEEKDRLREEIEAKKRREDEIELIIAKEREALNHRLNTDAQDLQTEQPVQPEPITEPAPPKPEGLLCPYCVEERKDDPEELAKLKPIGNKAGMSSHIKFNHSIDVYEAYQKIKDTMWDEYTNAQTTKA